MSSLATRLTLAVVGITAGTVLIAAVVMWWSLSVVLRSGVDRDLDNRAERTRRFDAMMSGRWRGPSRPPDGRAPRLMHILSANGSTVGPEPDTSLKLDDGSVPPDGWRGEVRGIRVLAVALQHPPPQAEGASPIQATVLIGEDLTPVHAELRRMAIGLATLWLVATGLAVGAALALRRSVLRPLVALDHELSLLRPEDLAARVPPGAGPDEVRRLVGRLNTLLGGLEEAFQREQATIANIAHELRTPVAGLRTEIEFRLLSSAYLDEQAVLRGLLATVGRMQGMVGNILMLARIEAGREHIASEPCDVVPLLGGVVERWESRALGRGLVWDMKTPDSMMAKVSSAHLDVVFDNLVGNAVAHAPPGSTITILLADGVLTIANACPGQVDPVRLGTAFYRADGARSNGAHCGLGLALCRRITALLAVPMDLSVADGQFTVRLTMTPG